MGVVTIHIHEYTIPGGTADGEDYDRDEAIAYCGAGEVMRWDGRLDTMKHGPVGADCQTCIRLYKEELAREVASGEWRV